MDEFLQKMGELYECILFTASLAKVCRLFSFFFVSLSYPTDVHAFDFRCQYADPVADLLDKWGVFRSRLFRESCVLHRGNYVKVSSRTPAP